MTRTVLTSAIKGSGMVTVAPGPARSLVRSRLDCAFSRSPRAR